MGVRPADLVGRRKLFIVGIVGFTIAPVICAAAPSSGVLIGFRVVQGAFGALLIRRGSG